jgi:hypothetical protein
MRAKTQSMPTMNQTENLENENIAQQETAMSSDWNLAP